MKKEKFHCVESLHDYKAKTKTCGYQLCNKNVFSDFLYFIDYKICLHKNVLISKALESTVVHSPLCSYISLNTNSFKWPFTVLHDLAGNITCM